MAFSANSALMLKCLDTIGLKSIKSSFLYALKALVTSLYFVKNNNLTKLLAILFKISFKRG